MSKKQIDKANEVLSFKDEVKFIFRNNLSNVPVKVKLSDITFEMGTEESDGFYVSNGLPTYWFIAALLAPCFHYIELKKADTKVKKEQRDLLSTFLTKHSIYNLSDYSRARPIAIEIEEEKKKLLLDISVNTYHENIKSLEKDSWLEKGSKSVWNSIFHDLLDDKRQVGYDFDSRVRPVFRNKAKQDYEKFSKEVKEVGDVVEKFDDLDVNKQNELIDSEIRKFFDNYKPNPYSNKTLVNIASAINYDKYEKRIRELKNKEANEKNIAAKLKNYVSSYSYDQDLIDFAQKLLDRMIEASSDVIDNKDSFNKYLEVADELCTAADSRKYNSSLCLVPLLPDSDLSDSKSIELPIISGITLVVGKSGTGKSTLVDYLLGMMTGLGVEARKFYFGEPDINSVTQEEVAKLFEKYSSLNTTFIIDSITGLLNASGDKAAGSGGLNLELMDDLPILNSTLMKLDKSLILVLNTAEKSDLDNLILAFSGKVSTLVVTEGSPNGGDFMLRFTSRYRDDRAIKLAKLNLPALFDSDVKSLDREVHPSNKDKDKMGKKGENKTESLSVSNSPLDIFLNKFLN